MAKAPFESINPTLCSPKAFYNGFRTTEERLPYWIQGMYHSVYRDLATDLDVDWDEQNTQIDLKIRISDPNVKDDEGKSRYKFTIWVYLTTGSIAFQGPDYQEAVQKLFPILKEYVIKNAGVLQSSAPMDPSENCQDQNMASRTAKAPKKSRIPKKKVSTTPVRETSKKKPSDKTFENMSTDISNLSESMKEMQSAFISVVYDDIVEKLSNEIAVLKNSVDNVVRENQLLKAEVANCLRSKTEDSKVISSLKDEISQLKSEFQRHSGFISEHIKDCLSGYVEEIMLSNQAMQDNVVKVVSEKVNAAVNRIDEKMSNITNFKPTSSQRDYPATHQGGTENDPMGLPSENIVLIGDSIINHVDPSRVKDSCAAKVKSVEKAMAYTIQEVAKVVNEQTSSPKTYVIHVGTNDLKNRPVNTAVEDMKHLCNSVLDKNPNNKLIISKVLPKVRAGRKTNNSLTMFNILVEDEFCEHKNVSFSHNNNFEKNGDYQRQFFGEDGTHLSETGVKVLSGNLINSIKRLHNLPVMRRNSMKPNGKRNFSRYANRRGFGGGSYSSG